MYDLYQVTLNGSPIHTLPLVPLDAAAYAAAVMQQGHRDSGPGVPAREYGIEYVVTRDHLTRDEWKAQQAAGDIVWDDDTPIALLCAAIEIREHGERTVMRQQLAELVSA